MHHSDEAMPNHKKQKTMKRITITVDPDDYGAFNQLAHQGGVTASWLIRRSMREFLEKHEREGEVSLNLGPTPKLASGGK